MSQDQGSQGEGSRVHVSHQGAAPAYRLPAGAVDFTLRLLLAGLFLYACADKLAHPRDFALLVKDYRLLPDNLVDLTALWLPWLELVLGACLVMGLFCEGALALAVLLLAVFWLALAVDYARGINVACGCFSSAPGGEEAAPMLWYLGRDALLLGFAVLALRARLRLVREERGERAS